MNAAYPIGVAREASRSHNIVVGYIAWLFGIFGAHRFYFGKPISGIIWFFTGGVFLVGWVIDFFLIPSMEREAARTYATGPCEYSIAWLLLAFGGVFGLHRFYMGKWISGLIYLLTGGLLFIGVIWDVLSMNDQIHNINLDR
ncbi:MAG: TM2 domain-containing protein [Planctomycetales bacterium]|nr:TM2 domain-containing protein [Planctomycetales bacterium]